DLPGEDLVHHLEVLDVDGLVEAPLLTDVLDLLRGGEPAGEAQRRVAVGHRLEDQERDDRDRDQHEEDGEQAPGDEPGHQCSMRTFARGSRASRTPSPKTLMPRTASTSISPGTSVRWIALGISRMPSLIIVPHEGFGSCTPAPRYDRPASSRIALAMMSGMKTMIVVRRLGRSSPNMIRTCPSPWVRAASMNSRRRRPSTWP